MTTVANAVVPSGPARASVHDGQGFLKYMPAVATHAAISFRRLPPADREDAIAEAVAAGFLNYESARRRGQLESVKPSMLAHYGVLHVRSGKHVGGSMDSKKDVMSFRAQQAGRFRVVGLPWDNVHAYDALKAPERVWRLRLIDDSRTPIPDQVRFRVDFSAFMGKQDGRTRKALALLAAGHKRCEVAEKLGVTPPAVTQRLARIEREWAAYQADEPRTPAHREATEISSRHGSDPAHASRAAAEPLPAA